ncbi:MAG: rod shape-determining protein MreB [Motiliproteus sp.]
MLGIFTDNFRRVLYVQIWEHRLKVTDINTDLVFDEKPLMAIETSAEGKKNIVGICSAAEFKSDSNIELVNPFHHPRVLLSDFLVAEKILQHAFRQLLGNKLFSLAPIVVVQPMEKTEGGLSIIEDRAFKELMISAGARVGFTYVGPELSNHQLVQDLSSGSSSIIDKGKTNRGLLSASFFIIFIAFLWWVKSN